MPLLREFLISTSISFLGDNLFDIAIPLYVWDRTHSAWALVLTSIALYSPYFVMAPLTGYLADHTDKRKALMFSDIGQVALLVMLFALDFNRSSDTYSFLIPLWCLIFVAKTCHILFETITTFHVIPALAKPEELPGANGFFFSAQRLIQVVGPILAGLLMEFIGYRACIVLNALTFAATLRFVWRVRHHEALAPADPNSPRRGHNLRSLTRNFQESLDFIWQSPLFRPFVGLMFFWNLSSFTPNSPSVTYFFRGVHGFSPTRFGFAISLLGLFGIVGFAFASQLYAKKRADWLVHRSALWQSICCSLAAFLSALPWGFVLAFALSRIAGSILSMGTFLLRQTEAPKHLSGSVNASLRMLFMLAMPLSAPCQGWLIQHFGVGSAFIFGAVCLWVATHFARQLALALQHRDEAVAAAA